VIHGATDYATLRFLLVRIYSFAPNPRLSSSNSSLLLQLLSPLSSPSSLVYIDVEIRKGREKDGDFFVSRTFLESIVSLSLVSPSLDLMMEKMSEK